MSRAESAPPSASSYDSLSPTSLSKRSGSRTSLLDLPPRENRGRSLAAVGGAVILHGGFVLLALGIGAGATHSVAQVDLSELIAVELPTSQEEPPSEEAPEAPEPEPEPVEAPTKPVPAAAMPKSSEPLDPPAEAEPEPPSAPAQAGEVLTAEEDVLDFGDTIISGKGENFAGGISSSGGTSKRAVRRPNARPGGVVGGTGSGKPVRKKSVNLSRAPRLAGGMQWNCPFPVEADIEQIDHAAVSLQIQVAPSGKVQNVTVLSDPGYGFGRAAQRCAQRKAWDPGLNTQGLPTSATTRIKVRFQRS